MTESALMTRPLKWTTHADLAIQKTPTVGRREYLDHMTFRRRDRVLFTEIFGPLIGLREEWEEQGASPAELDFSAFRYRCEARGYVAEFIKPYYRRIWDLLAERGARLFDQDSDGNMNGVIESFLDAGVNCMHPMEPAAGMDVVEVRRRYGTRLAFYGGIDKHVLRRSHDDIVRELEYKIPPWSPPAGA